LAAAAIFAVVGAPRADATVTHVAVVIAGQHSACVDWHAGMTGKNVIDAAAATNWGQAGPTRGLLLQINQLPVNPDTTANYWTYYEDSGAGWHWSNLGPASTHPAAGTLEGWAYSPTSGPDVVPPASSYASICAGKDAPAPPPAPVTKPAPAKTTKPAAATSKAPPAAPAPVTSAAPTSSTAVALPASSAGQSSGPGLVFTEPSTSASPVPTASPSLAAGKKTSSGSPVALIVAGCAIAALAAAGAGTAWFRNTRRE
jgi:hypothetical protein